MCELMQMAFESLSDEVLSLPLHFSGTGLDPGPVLDLPCLCSAFALCYPGLALPCASADLALALPCPSPPTALPNPILALNPPWPGPSTVLDQTRLSLGHSLSLPQPLHLAQCHSVLALPGPALALALTSLWPGSGPALPWQSPGPDPAIFLALTLLLAQTCHGSSLCALVLTSPCMGLELVMNYPSSALPWRCPGLTPDLQCTLRGHDPALPSSALALPCAGPSASLALFLVLPRLCLCPAVGYALCYLSHALP
ncbi:hypothetical protein P7K49_017387 [Saguinus oedipus]|uniref:Uncharacterized protein n=1 Tax=Saguinus oedipus TaxID=9490 RepID=A0ABQ9V2S3_SAGOE|nr:hypothetical protein P7K49_017387 [Saguinus oedipus]